MSNVTIKYGDQLFYAEGTHESVCQAIVEGWSLEVRRHPESKLLEKIIFFGDVDWVAEDVEVDL
jgi:hypothetical protein